MNYINEDDFIKSYAEEEILVIKFKERVFELIESFHETNFLMKILEHVKYDELIKFVVFTSEPHALGSTNYDEFIHEIIREDTSQKDPDFPVFNNKNARYREITLVDTLIQFIVDYNKLSVACFEGDIATPFFGFFLANDIRYASPSTSFSLLHNRYGLHPSGALPFFLVQEIGYSKSVELLLSETLSVYDAEKLGLVDRIIPSVNFLDRCISQIHKYSYIHYSTILNTKRLSSFTRNSLHDYIQYESSLLNLS